MMRFTIFSEKLIPVKANTPDTFTITHCENIPTPPINPHFQPNEHLLQKLYGKQLLFDEIGYPLEEIQQHYENGYIFIRKGITKEKGMWKCCRCGNTDPSLFATFPCSRCQEKCTYCRNCIIMGRVTSCTPLYSWRPSKQTLEMIPAEHTYLSWNGSLSPGQQLASERVIDAVSHKRDLLLWAVCGAGKTEVLFAGIDHALKLHHRVCIATPRTDVVLELAPRLQKVFPTLQVAALYGGTPDRHLFSPLTIATTHQLFRFYQAFDTIILDEVDAFPYSFDKTLQYAVEQARKPKSAMIYLTATPNEKWQIECAKGKRAFVTIPARYHRHPLPVPEFVWCGNWQKILQKEKLPTIVFNWLKQRMDANKQALLFIPKIELIPKLLPILQKCHPAIEGVHAEDVKRKEKVQKMREKEIPVLVTTTILERGVTFPNIDVAVLGAEDEIFTESALVQIAGRVGRSAKFPFGTVTFFHYGITRAMHKARRQIVSMNKEAKEKGLIDVE